MEVGTGKRDPNDILLSSITDRRQAGFSLRPGALSAAGTIRGRKGLRSTSQSRDPALERGEETTGEQL